MNQTRKTSSSIKATSLAVLFAAAALSASPAAFAERPTRGDSQERAERKAQHMERMVRERLSPRLSLDSATEDELVRLFQETAHERRAAMRAVHTERDALRSLVDAGASDAQLNAQLDRLYAALEKVPNKGALLDKTAAILTPAQQAELALSAPKGMHGKHGKHGKHGRHGMGGQERKGWQHQGKARETP